MLEICSFRFYAKIIRCTIWCVEALTTPCGIVIQVIISTSIYVHILFIYPHSYPLIMVHFIFAPGHGRRWMEKTKYHIGRAGDLIRVKYGAIGLQSWLPPAFWNCLACLRKGSKTPVTETFCWGGTPLQLLVGDIGSERWPGGCKLLIQTPPLNDSR